MIINWEIVIKIESQETFRKHPKRNCTYKEQYTLSSLFIQKNAI